MAVMVRQRNRNDKGDDLKWLRDCDKLKDSKGNPLLPIQAGNEIPIECGDIVYILDEFIKKSSASEDVMKEIQGILTETISSTMVDISEMFDRGGLMHDAFEKIDLKTMRMASKFKFVCYTVMGKLFCSLVDKWKRRREFLVEICCTLLCGLPKSLDMLPHHNSDPAKLMKHHKAKDFLSRVSVYLWKDFLCRNNIPVAPEVLIPLMRKLAMLDIIDANWNAVGCWNDILQHVEMQCNVYIEQIPSDKILHEKSMLLHDGRDSMRCKQIRLTQKRSDKNGMYCCELQRKCSSPSCSNIESRERPHKLRCHECFYFHWCSKACYEYCCKFTNIHSYLCKDTPPEEKQALQQQVTSFLSDDNKKELTDKRDSCAACGAHKEAFEITLIRCTYCSGVNYCSKICQEWDWVDGGHMQVCERIKEQKVNKNDDKEG